MTQTCRKILGTAHQSPARYLFSGQYRGDELIKGSVKPIPNQLLAVAAEQPTADGKDVEWVTQLWGTNGLGYLDRLDNGFALADRVRDVRLGDPLPFLALPLEEVATLVATQEESWQQALVKALPVALLKERLKDQAYGKPCRFRQIDTEYLQRAVDGGDEYRCWYQEVEGRVLEGWVLPRQRAAVVAFSSNLFQRSEVALWPEGGEVKTYASETVAESNDQAGNFIYAVTFVPGPDEPALSPGFYRIRVAYALGIKPNGSSNMQRDEQGRYYYEFTEKLRFDIQNLAGEFSFINGDPLFLEECILKQFPQLYRGHIQSARALSRTGGAGKTGLAAYAHDFGVRHSATGLASSVLGSESPEARFWAYGKFIQTAVAKYGSDEAKHLMAAVYDTKEAVDKLRGYLAGSHGLNAAGEIKIKDYLPGRWFDANRGWLAQTEARTLKISRFQLPGRYVNFFNQAMSLYEQGAGIKAIGDSALAYGRARARAEENRDLHRQLVADYASCVGEPHEESFEELNGSLRRLAETFAGQHRVDRSELARREGRLTASLDLCFDVGDDEVEGLDLQPVADYILEHPRAQVHLVGHADRIGSEPFNMALSRRRADNVKALLLRCAGEELAGRVSSEGRGSREAKVEEGSRSERRVSLVVTVPASRTRFWPSREGMQNLERSRARTENDRLQLDEALNAALGSLYDAAIGLGMLFPATAQVAGALALVESGARALRSAAMVADDLLFDQVLAEFLKQQELENDLLRRAKANRRGIRFAGEEREAAEELDNQLRIRADVINGLVGLIHRASYAAAQQAQGAEARREAFLRIARKEYQIDDYIRLFLFAESWHYPSCPYYNLGMDQYWLDFVDSQDDMYRLFKQASDPLYQQRYREYLEQRNQRGREQLAQGVMGIQGAVPMPSNILAADPEAITVRFQEIFPVHGFSSESLGDLYQDIDLNYSHLTEQMYDFTEVRFRPRGARRDEPWLTLAQWRQRQRRPLSFLDQARVIVVLKDEESYRTPCPLTLRPVRQVFSFDEELGVTKPLVAELQRAAELHQDLPERKGALVAGIDVEQLQEVLAGLVDRVQDYFGDLAPDLIHSSLGRVEGPAYTEICLPLGAEDLLEEEQQFKGRYGAVFYPRYFYGGSNLPGTKPMTSNILFPLDWLRWTRDDRLSMTYCYQVGIDDHDATRRDIRVAGDDRHYQAHRDGEEGADFADGFELTLNRQHKDWHGDEADQCAWRDEALLFDRTFMQGAFSRYEYPELLKGGIKTYALYRFGDDAFTDATGPFLGSRQAQTPAALRAEGKRLHADGFDWEMPVDLACVVSCSALDSDRYQALKQRWTSLPFSLQLVENSVTESGGLTVNGRLLYLGSVEVVKSHEGEVGLKFVPSSAAEREIAVSPGLIALQEQLTADGHRLQLAAVAGIHANGDNRTIPPGLLGIRRHLFAAVHRFEYTSLTGEKVASLRPFGSASGTWDAYLGGERVDPGSNETAPFIVALRNMSTAGDSGLKNGEVSGAVEVALPAPQSYFDGVPWVRLPDDQAVKQARERLGKNRQNRNDGKMPPYRMDKLMSWLALETKNQERRAVKKWIEEGVAPIPEGAEAFQ